MYHGVMRRNVDAAVFLRRGKTVYVVVFVDSAAYRAKAVVAVGQNVRNGEFVEPYRFGCLNDSDVSDIVRRYGVESDMQGFAFCRFSAVMRGEDLIRHGAGVTFVRRSFLEFTGDVPVAFSVKFYHCVLRKNFIVNVIILLNYILSKRIARAYRKKDALTRLF